MTKFIPFPPLKKTLLQLLGPSIVFVALSLNGGEMLLWPSLTANYGMAILWPLLIILTLQFIVNIEIERYTLVTGKSTEAYLVGNVRWLAAVFVFAVVVSLVWPAWMSTAGNLLVTVVLSPETSEEVARNAGLIATITLLGLSITVFILRNTYLAVERLARVGLVLALGIITITVLLNFNLTVFIDGLRGLFRFGYLPADIPRFDFLGAIAYGGVAGVLNLVQSEWIRDKGYGVAGLKPSQQKAIEFTSKKSRKNFRDWFIMMNKEHFLLFYLANVFSIFLLSYLGAILLPLGSAQGFSVLVAEIRILNDQIPFLGSLFSVAGMLIFIMANVTILDAIGRLSHRIIEPLASKRVAHFFTASRISVYAILIGIGILILSILFPSFKQPYILLVTSASLSSIVMWLYPPLLLKLNMQLPQMVQPALWRRIMVLLCTAFYGAVSLWALSSLLPVPIVAGIGTIVTLYQIYFLFFRKM